MKGIKIHTDPILGCGKFCVSGERFFKFLYVDVNLDCGAISRILEINKLQSARFFVTVCCAISTAHRMNTYSQYIYLDIYFS